MALTDAQGRTPLHYAAAVNDSGDIYRILEELGSDVYKEDMVRMLQPYILHHLPKHLSITFRMATRPSITCRTETNSNTQSCSILSKAFKMILE